MGNGEIVASTQRGDVARFLADSIGGMDHFKLITDGSELLSSKLRIGGAMENRDAILVPSGKSQRLLNRS